MLPRYQDANPWFNLFGVGPMLLWHKNTILWYILPGEDPVLPRDQDTIL